MQRANDHAESASAILTADLIERAKYIGFDLCGVAPAADFPELAHLEDWLSRGHGGEMRYLQDPRRRSPSLVVQNARSVIVCALNYNSSLPYSTEVPADFVPGPRPAQDVTSSGVDHAGTRADTPSAGPPPTGPHGWISRYAWGDEYHTVLGEKLDALVRWMRDTVAEPFEARAYVDTGPVVERVAAKYAGLGWLAKNTCLINEELGSWLFLGVIVTTLELAPSIGAAEAPPEDLCGNCRLCIEACPTQAIVEPYVLDARRCISYLTIELRGEIPIEFREAIGRHAFGCDICQDVCPWNRTAPRTSSKHFQPRETESNSLFSPDLEWLMAFTQEEFSGTFRDSPLKRTKLRGLIRNACVAVGNSGLRRGQPRYEEICARLTQLAAGEDAILSEHARWALGRLENNLTSR